MIGRINPARNVRLLRTSLTTILCAVATLVTADTKTPYPPWHEKTVVEHLDFASVAGKHTAGTEHPLFRQGERLFTSKFTRSDGLGRPMATQAIVPTKRRREGQQILTRTSGPDALSCAACHNDPSPGGAGDFSVNAFVSEGFSFADFDSLDPQFSNERGTTALFGAGFVELLAREMTADLKRQRKDLLASSRRSGHPEQTELETKGVSFGRLTVFPDGRTDTSGIKGVDPDLVIRPFSQKGVIVSLRQFTVNALNHHHGMQAVERFGKRWTGSEDFDEDGVPNELTEGDVSALVAFQATLPIPLQRPVDDPTWQRAAKSGEEVFQTLGCAECHRPALPLRRLKFSDPGPYDMAGTLRATDVSAPVEIDLEPLAIAAGLDQTADGDWLVPLYGDLKRHTVSDKQIDRLGNELLAQRFVARDKFLTQELWGVASTAPYGHRGDLTTLREIVLAHGGDARASRDLFAEADAQTQSALIAFLRTLTAP